MTEHKDIHEAINAIMQEVGYVQKQSAKELRYTYASEASFIEAIRPAMVKHGVYVKVHKVKKVYRSAYETKNGTNMFNTLIEGVVRFTHVSGTSSDCEATGEGSDSGDKSANKAMTGLYKYALRQTFCIETGDDPDQFSSDDMERAYGTKILPANPQRSGNASTAKKSTPSNAPETQESTETTSNAPEIVPGASGEDSGKYSVSELRSAEIVVSLKGMTGKEVPVIMKAINGLDKNGRYSVEEVAKLVG